MDLWRSLTHWKKDYQPRVLIVGPLPKVAQRCSWLFDYFDLRVVECREPSDILRGLGDFVPDLTIVFASVRSGHLKALKEHLKRHAPPDHVFIGGRTRDFGNITSIGQACALLRDKAPWFPEATTLFMKSLCFPPAEPIVPR